MTEPRTDDVAGEERLYDEYLELALSGDAPDPGVFLAERGSASAELRQRLSDLRRAGVGAPAIDDAALPFATLGEYRLIERIGRGGMGLVFLAEQRSLERKVALKVLRPELAGSNLALERFKREARAIAKLRHPGIVAVFGFGEEHGVRYLAMEYLPGRTLEEELRAAPVALSRKVRWLRDLARALDYAHREGVIHRDVKPSNVRITPDDRALLVDFGLVRSTSGESATLTDSFAGSPSYASPEQISDASKVDVRTDVYSLGVTLYRCLTGVVPFDGDSVEQVFHRILVGQAVPLRRIDPSIPRDLEVVTLKAMERNPARRYASAAELADELDAVLELRPIRARPPGVFGRAVRAAKRRKVAATSLLTGSLLLLAFGGYSLDAARREQHARRSEASRTVELARDRVQAYHDSRAKFAGMQKEVGDLQYQMQYAFLPDEQFRLLDAKESEVEELERAWETTFYEVLELLRQAERLDPNVAGTEKVRAQLYGEKHREAVSAYSDDEAEFYRDLVEKHDPRGEVASEMRGLCTEGFRSEPPGASVHLFRYREQSRLVPGGEPRMVAVPHGDDAPPVPPGTWCLRVTADRGELRSGDHVLEIAGAPIERTVFVVRAPPPLAFLDRIVSVDGQAFDDAWAVDHLGPAQVPGPDGTVPIRTFAFLHDGERVELRATSLEELAVVVATPAQLAALPGRDEIACVAHRDGELLRLRLPPGAQVRTTASPLLESPRCLLGLTPVAQVALARGEYIALFRLPGHEDRRVPFSQLAGQYTQFVRLDPLGTTPAGFVRMTSTAADDSPATWIQEHEVTADQYLEFVNDPETAEAIASSSEPRLFPRQSYTGKGVPLWTRKGDGTWELDPPWRGDFPVVGVTWADATEFARWKTRRARAQGLDVEFALPTTSEFFRAGAGGLRRYFSWGVRYRPRWSRTCFARPRADLGPVLHFPVDESPFGAYDFCGGAGEWLDGWYDQARNLRYLGGGAWGQPFDSANKVTGGNGVSDGVATGECGFRLVMRRTGERR